MLAEKYCNSRKRQWDRFVMKSRNHNFQHFRDYTDYHKDRFTDHSLLFCSNGNIMAVLPANRVNDELHSHQGLTFGGILVGTKTKQKEVLNFFDLLLEYASKNSIKKICLKPQPHIYDSYTSEEILYALFKNGAALTGRNVSSVIDLKNLLNYGKGRKWSLKKSVSNDIVVSESADIAGFMKMKELFLEKKHQKKPVHTAAEMIMLKEIFPDNIRLFTAAAGGSVIAGVVLYITERVVKCQYICSTDIGRKLNATSLLFDELIHRHFPGHDFFDFGHSNLDDGRYLEDSLIQNKESYGARAVCYDTYTIKL